MQVLIAVLTFFFVAFLLGTALPAAIISWLWGFLADSFFPGAEGYLYHPTFWQCVGVLIVLRLLFGGLGKVTTKE